MRRRVCLCALGALGAGTYGGATAMQPLARLQLPDVGLIDQDGAPHRLRALCEQTVVIGFFYTGCSTVCPPQTAALRALRERLDARGGHKARPRAFCRSASTRWAIRPRRCGPTHAGSICDWGWPRAG